MLRLVALFQLVAAVVFLASCTPDVYHTRADKEVYGALFSKSEKVENVEPMDVGIEDNPTVDLSPYRKNSQSFEYLGDVASYEREAKVLSLSDSLEAGVTYGRAYRTEKERLYLSALDLTLARFRLAPIFNVNGEGVRAGDSRNARIQQGVNELVSTNTMARTQTAGFNWLSRTGARVSADFTQDFLRLMTGNRSINDSDLAVSLVQPLLQGGGTAVTMEALTQEERNLLYDLRDFAAFRREYIVALVSAYYGVLRAKDQVRNNHAAYLGFLKNVEVDEAFVAVGKRTKNQLGQLKQATLRAESNWINSILNYQSRLDDFKITLGLPVDEKLILDYAELSKLTIAPITLSRDEAVRIALVARPELATIDDQLVDAKRRVKVAENGLLPGLDVSVDYNSVSNPGDTTPAINFDRRRWSTSIDLDLPLDRKAERNTYRASLIAVQRAERNAEEQKDRVRLAIYDAWRELEQARRNFTIAEKGVALATARLEEQELRAELGTSLARDLIEARNDLLDARNQRTSTLVDHTLARLRLWRDMGILYINEDGSWVKKLENETP